MSKADQACLGALAEARALIRSRAPYFQTIVYGFVPRFVAGLGSLGVTDKMVLIVDPAWYTKGILDLVVSAHENDKAPTPNKEILAKEAAEMRAGVLVHEAMHWLRGMDRIARMPDPDLANIAFDLPINHDLREAGWSLPRWVVYPETYGLEPGLTGEAYYELLQKKGKKEVYKLLAGATSGGSGSSNSGTRGDPSSSNDGSGMDSSGGSSNSPPGQVAAGRCGSCAGGSLGKVEEETKEIGRTQADCERIRKNGIADIRSAMQSGAGRGSIPGSLTDLLDEDLQPSVVPWKQLQARIIRRCTGRVVSGMADFSMRRPSRRSQVRGVIRPSMVDKKPEIVLIEDSSGSMGKEQLQNARSEACGVLQQLGLDEVWFMDADANVAAPPKRVRLRTLRTMGVHGRGGTDFRPGIAASLKLKPKPDLCIYFTDGDGIAPEHPPKGMEVIWCIVPTPYGRRPAKWGHLVVVSDDQSLRDPYEHRYEEDEDEDY